MGGRIIEELREDKTEEYGPIIVNYPKSGIDISFNQNTPILDLFEQAGYCSLNSEPLIRVDDILITQILLDNELACNIHPFGRVRRYVV
ncbi:hypothetical protein [Acetivibrio straminisolvens]|jgi:hypothetical protein|uniref:Uncharacterized protein n=1 Tax=Acetivibrio straminisolvens JCM 21531 TaxID=1294263 RepID=W4VBA5_9FIRM|nr:hypothetical protein [Acetivibrio straminisolvens]GAE90472.1 hypothetical protein JCM21531_4088 [Acetivibrio straminisolvens JCM 21531]